MCPKVRFLKLRFICIISACSFVSLADVVFIVDASSSEGPLGFQKQLDSVSRIVNDFHIGPDNVQISLVSFSESAHAQFYLNLWLTKIQVLAAIQRTRYIPGTFIYCSTFRNL